MLSQVRSEIEAIKTVLASFRHSHHDATEREQRLYELSNHNHAILVYMGFSEEKLHEMLVELQKKENHLLATEAYQNTSGLSVAFPLNQGGEMKDSGTQATPRLATNGVQDIGHPTARKCWSILISMSNVRGMRRTFVKYAHDFHFKGFVNRITRDCIQIRIVFPDPTHQLEVEERIFKFFDYFKRHHAYDEVEEGKVTTNFIQYLDLPFTARKVSARILHEMEKDDWSDDAEEDEAHPHYDHYHRVH